MSKHFQAEDVFQDLPFDPWFDNATDLKHLGYNYHVTIGDSDKPPFVWSYNPKNYPSSHRIHPVFNPGDLVYPPPDRMMALEMLLDLESFMIWQRTDKPW